MAQENYISQQNAGRHGKNPNKYYTLVDAKILAGTSPEMSSGLGQYRFMERLITNLVKNGCPVRVINRVFYCFDSLYTAKNYSPYFNVLGHDNVLCKYSDENKEMWRFVGTGYGHGLTLVNNESKQIFDKLESVLHNQRHNLNRICI